MKESAAPPADSLPPHVRKLMESRFGVDFSGVRVHTDASAATDAANLGARAFTKNREIYFAPGHYRPDTRVGQALIAHELAHVAQQRQNRSARGGLASMTTVASANNSLEREAMSAERAFLQGQQKIAVQEAATDGIVLRSPMEGTIKGMSVSGSGNASSFDFGLGAAREMVGAIAAAAKGGIQAVADFIADNLAAGDALIGRINTLRKEISAAATAIVLSPKAVALAQSIYNAVAPYIPSWLPSPDLQFGPAVQTAIFIVAGIAIGAVELALILAFILCMLWLLLRANPDVRKAQDKAIEDLIRDITESRKPKQKKEPEPEKKPDQPPITDPPPIPKPEDKEKPKAYPICWATQLGPPTTNRFVRTKSERDEEKATQARMAMQWRAFRDPDFDPERFHVHHVVPLFLGGPDDLRANGTYLEKNIHLKGHRVLQQQPQMLMPPPPLPPLPADMYSHPVGTPYELKGFKESPDEKC